jgi:hypothetical protein
MPTEFDLDHTNRVVYSRAKVSSPIRSYLMIQASPRLQGVPSPDVENERNLGARDISLPPPPTPQPR